MQTSLFDSSPQARADLAACRDMLREGSRTFLAASFVLPAAVSEPACALYAFCRMADDEFDLNDGGSDALAALSDRLDRIYAQRPSRIAADRAFAEVVWRFGIPRAIPDALLEGFAWDAAGQRYKTLSDLKAYAVRVAGTVGAMMTLLMGQRSRDVVARACELGVAMQLTNIARDVGEDARAGRLYLPLEWLRESGIDGDAFVAKPAYSDALGSVVQRLLAAADVHYASCESGIAGLPRACRPGIMAARALYAEIGREVERGGCDSVSKRAVVPASRKVWLLAQTVISAMTLVPGGGYAAIPEAEFLVEAVARTEPPYIWRPDPLPWWNLNSRLVRLIELFERLERREQAERIQA